MTNLLLRVKLSDDRRVEHSPTRVSRATGKMATPSDGVVPGLFGVESSALGAAEDTVGRGSMHRNADSETDDDEDEELRPPLDIPLFAVEKVLAVRSRSKDPGGEVRRSSSTSSPAAGGSARASSDPPSGAFASEDDASGAAGRAPRAREGRRELVAAACTSEAAARPGDPPATRVFHAAAHASEEGTRHHLLLRAERVARAGTSEGAERASDADEKNARARFNKMLPWYEGEQARITSLEFSPPCCSSDADGPLLLCGTRGGGVYVIPAGAALRASSEDAEDAEGAAAPAIRVLRTAGSPIVSALWWRKRVSSGKTGKIFTKKSVVGGVSSMDGSCPNLEPYSETGEQSLVAVACARDGEIRFWSARGAPLCAVFVGGRAASAAAVDAGPDLGQFLLISGERASAMAAAMAAESVLGTDADARPKAHWTLALERGGASLPEAAGRRGFSPTLVEGRFGAPDASDASGASSFLSRAALSVHVGAHDEALGAPDDARVENGKPASGAPVRLSSTLVARLSAAAETLALFHPANDRDAIATYRVPPGTIAVRVTRRLIFALHRRGNGRARLSAMAREDEAASRGRRRARGDEDLGADADADAGDEKETEKETGPAWATPLRPVWKYSEIVPVVLQELTLSAGVGRPLARALMPCGDRRGEESRAARFGIAAFEGCAVAAQGATLACRPATPSSETVVRGLLGTVRLGAEADAFARAARRAAGKDAARRRGEAPRADPTDPTDAAAASAAAAARRRGDLNAETLLNVLDVPRARRAVLYAEAVERAASVGDVARAAALAPKAAPRAATALCVAACLGEWRAADALDHLDHLAASRPTRVFANDTANTTRITRTDASVSSRDTHNNTHEEAWLRLCCAAHLELSAWAASAAAAAIGAAGEIAEDVPDASATFPWPSGALSPPLAADAAEALARSAAAAAQKGAHRSLGSLQAAARAARLAADAAAGITALLRAVSKSSSRGDGDEARAARLDAMVALRATLAAASAADTFQRGGEALRRFVEYAAPTKFSDSLEEEEEEDDEGAARSPASAARAVAAAAAGGSAVEGGAALFGPERDARSDSSAIIAVLPLMRPEETAALAASASGPGAAETRVAARLSLAASARGRAGAAEAQRRLERTLCEGLRAGTVRPQWAIAATIGFDNSGAAAVALASAGDWLAATRRRLRAVEDAFPANASEASESAIQEALASTLSEYASRAETTAARAAALAAVARAWRARGLSREALETLLLADADAVGAEALAALLRGEGAAGARGAETGDASDASSAREGTGTETGTGTVRSDLVSFSASFALEVASLRVRVAARDGAGDDDGASETEDASAAGDDDNENAKTRNRETEASRWSRARRALCADEATAAAVYFSAYEVRREVRRDEDGVAFTCGHVASDASLRASAAALADAWRDAGCPMSGHLVAAEYAKRRVALACPACVGAAAREVRYE